MGDAIIMPMSAMIAPRTGRDLLLLCCGFIDEPPCSRFQVRRCCGPSRRAAWGADAPTDLVRQRWKRCTPCEGGPYAFLMFAGRRLTQHRSMRLRLGQGCRHYAVTVDVAVSRAWLRLMIRTLMAAAASSAATGSIPRA